jgi:3-oxoacyl-[acyl-carrier-protein] synthase II
MANHRVVITGLGIVAPNGIGKEPFWRNLIAGKSAVDRVFSFDASQYPCQVAAEVRDFSAADFMAAPKAKAMGRFSQFAVAATRLALDDAKLTISPKASDRVGIVYGTSAAGIGDVAADVFHGFATHGFPGIPPQNVVEYSTHLAAGHIAAEFKIHGPALSVSSNCCTGIDAIYAAYAQIKLGKVHVSLAGG